MAFNEAFYVDPNVVSLEQLEEFLRVKNMHGRAGDYTYLMTWVRAEGHMSRALEGKVFITFWQHEAYSDVWSSGWIDKCRIEWLERIGAVDRTQEVLDLTKDITWLM